MSLLPLSSEINKTVYDLMALRSQLNSMSFAEQRSSGTVEKTEKAFEDFRKRHKDQEYHKALDINVYRSDLTDLIFFGARRLVEISIENDSDSPYKQAEEALKGNDLERLMKLVDSREVHPDLILCEVSTKEESCSERGRFVETTARMTLLGYLCFHGDLDRINKLLAQNHVDVNFHYRDVRFTPTPIARTCSSTLINHSTKINILQQLIAKGADVFISDTEHFSDPTISVCTAQDPEILQLLLESTRKLLQLNVLACLANGRLPINETSNSISKMKEEQAEGTVSQPNKITSQMQEELKRKMDDRDYLIVVNGGNLMQACARPEIQNAIEIREAAQKQLSLDRRFQHLQVHTALNPILIDVCIDIISSFLKPTEDDRVLASRYCYRQRFNRDCSWWSEIWPLSLPHFSAAEKCRASTSTSTTQSTARPTANSSFSQHESWLFDQLEQINSRRVAQDPALQQRECLLSQMLRVVQQLQAAAAAPSAAAASVANPLSQQEIDAMRQNLAGLYAQLDQLEAND